METNCLVFIIFLIPISIGLFLIDYINDKNIWSYEIMKKRGPVKYPNGKKEYWYGGYVYSVKEWKKLLKKQKKKN